MSEDCSILEALAAAVAGDRIRAAALLIEACPTEDDGWVAACGYAAMICAGVRVCKEVDDHAPMTAFAIDDPDAGPDTDDYAEILAAFIAAIGNDDYEGGRRMFKSLRTADRKQRLIGDLLSIAVLVVQRQARREGTS